MDRPDGSQTEKSKIVGASVLFMLVGIFTIAVGLGVFFFNSQKPQDVKIISASNYDDWELAKPQVEGAAVGNLVDVNSATQKELEDLPGIGPVTAGKIIAGRPYQSVEELLVKKAVGRALYEKINSQLTVGE